ncbi:MAG: energy transducer TonB [Gallionella sp.]|nr:energy transducer TonB [Gallionella sp.]
MSPANTALPAIPLRERVVVLALVLLLHAGLVFAWMMQPALPKLVLNELSVSIAMQTAEVAKPQALPQPAIQAQSRTKHAEKPIQKQAVQQIADAEAPSLPVAIAQPMADSPAISSAPVTDTEPDYKARYLNNPRPAYPMAARRMGWQGRVILNVEVLAEGACGEVSVLHSSGHEVLDNAAMNTVKSWRFVPAKRAGRIVTQWFKVPIVFSLEDNAV